MIFQWNKNEVVTAQGPFTWKYETGHFEEHSQIGVQIKTEGQRSSFHVVSDLVFNKIDEEYSSKIVVSKENKLVSSCDIQALARGSTYMLKTKMDIPSAFKTSLSLVKSSQEVKSSFGLTLGADRKSPRVIESEIILQTPSAGNGKVFGKLFWDKARDQKKSILVSGMYKLSNSTQLQMDLDLR